ncbi:hypothetical protein MKQ70_18270 [Chitinophaga sedimenti]|uniref:hypothetical protein n=1 Tax=Chitinophaga sedimenti TaxID=2033606 RepID=UPI002003E0AD|nr:hypothetical protein [Chitinophaga sedimenti]MCK7556856.1 hypothetical protein [Chitinophaga sedimenti]
MIQISDVRVSDRVLVNFEGQLIEGTVLEVNHEDRQVCVLTHEQQEFWYSVEDLFPITLNEAELVRLKFHQEDPENGSTIYVRGPFKVEFHGQDKLALVYRDERREIQGPITVHQLQNHYESMTKVHLE